MKRVGVFCCVIVYCIMGTSSLKCNMCLGSLTSDCARNDRTAMVVQTCMEFPGDVPWRKSFGTTTPMPAEPSDDMGPDDSTNSPWDEEDDNSTYPHHHHHHHHHHHMRPKLDSFCAYVKLKADNTTSTGFVDRACGYMPPKQDLCAFLKKHVKNLELCKTCSTDECN